MLIRESTFLNNQGEELNLMKINVLNPQIAKHYLIITHKKKIS